MNTEVDILEEEDGRAALADDSSDAEEPSAAKVLDDKTALSPKAAATLQKASTAMKEGLHAEVAYLEGIIQGPPP